VNQACFTLVAFSYHLSRGLTLLFNGALQTHAIPLKSFSVLKQIFISSNNSTDILDTEDRMQWNCQPTRTKIWVGLLVSKSHRTLHYPKLILYLKKALFEDEQW